jgi:hypothetical protein
MMTTVTKGRALREDLNQYDGINLVGTRRDSTGGYLTGVPIGDEVDLLMVYGSGSERNNQTIQNAVTAIGTRKATIKFAPGTWDINASVTVPANLTARIPAGVTFDIDSGVTLTFSGPVIEDSQNIKTGSGTLTYTDERMLQSVAGTNTITASTLSTLTTLKNGQEFYFVPANTITGAATGNINSTGAINLRKNQSGGPVALVANDMIAGNLYKWTYNSTGPYFMVSCLSSYAQGADVASATTINLDTATGDYVHVTGSTAITGVTLKQGQARTIVFDGALTFTHGASLILPEGVSITTATGDIAILRGEASGVVRCISYERADDPRLAKFWCYASAVGTPAIQTSYNVTSITDLGVGNIRVTIANDLSDTPCFATSAFDNAGAECFCCVDGATVGTVEVFLSDDAGTRVDVLFGVVGFGAAYA